MREPRWAALPRGLPCTTLLLLLLVSLGAGGVLGQEKESALFRSGSTQTSLAFTHSLYNGTLHENALGKTYVETPMRMGVPLFDDSLAVSYEIIQGGAGIFRPEEYVIGDFCFLRVRTSTTSYRSLNRELRELRDQGDRYVLQIRAVGSRKSGAILSATTTLVVTLLDRNDLNPLFDPETYNVTIPENTPLHSEIVRVSASDADIGLNGEIYFSFMQRTEEFAVHPTSGVVTVTRPLKFSERSRYDFDVEAADRGPKSPHSRSGRAKLWIYITSVNYHPPDIRVQTHPSIIEHGQMGMIYAVLTVTDLDKGRNGEVHSVAITGGDARGAFAIEAGHGRDEYAIVVRSEVSREQAPLGYNLTVTAIDAGQPPLTSTATVGVSILDVNAHAPHFSQSSYNTSVSEVAPAGTPVIKVVAEDEDWGRNALLQYRIASGNDDSLFTINAKNGIIFTAVTIDAEKYTQVELTVEAEDQAILGSRRVGKAMVTIHILDFNDNAPSFGRDPLAGSVPENALRGTSVMTVVATDADRGSNGRVSYSIANSDEVPFDIDSFDGTMRTKEVLDFETMKRTYKVRVRASDWGEPFRRESEAIVTVRLTDENDNKPEFENTQCQGYISRDAPVGTPLVVMPAIDFDGGNIISYEIVGGNNDGCFRIIPSSGALTLACDLGNSMVNERKVTVVALDGLHRSDPTTLSLAVMNTKQSTPVSVDCVKTNVTDRYEQQLHISLANNDDSREGSSGGALNVPDPNINSPKFGSSAPLFLEVNEETPVGTVVANVTATDEDARFSGKLVYVVSGGHDEGAFRMDTFSGQLLINSPLDREQVAEYDLTVTAFDLGDPQKSASRSVKVTVADANDNAPRFRHPSYEQSISESVGINATLLQVDAEDADIGLNARLTYSLVSDSPDFAIDPLSGILRVAAPLDREQQETYRLWVQAKDSGLHGVLSSSTLVTIKLLDVNDNPPTFVPSMVTVKVREDMPVGSVITTLTAHDPDLGAGGQVSYSLQYGQEDKFRIDRPTGTVRLVKSLDYETKQVYNISVRAMDGGSQPLAAECLLNVEVVNVDENLHAPEFPEFYARGTVWENRRIGTFVMQVQARDRDTAEEAGHRIIYSIVDGTGLGRFTIDSNGSIFTAAVLDAESASHYWLTVLARDSAPVPRWARVEVFIAVVDVNDNVPLALAPSYSASVPENSPADVSVVTVQAWDGDASPDQKLTFAITRGDPKDFFAIDPRTGVISTTSHSLDREEQADHALEVTITDEGKPPLSSTVRVVVSVADVNDNRPRFLDRSPRLWVFETAGGPDPGTTPTLLYRAVARDKDSGRNGAVTYRSEEAQDPLSLDPNTGEIFATRGLVAGESFELTVRAMDNGKPTRKSSSRVKIRVNPRPPRPGRAPVFQDGGTSVRIMSTDPAGHFVVLLLASDPDGDPLLYSIRDGDPGKLFMVQPLEGSLQLAAPVDESPLDHHNLSVCATDGHHSACTWVSVTVIRVKRYAPEFSALNYSAQVQESAGHGSHVLQVSATDRDPGDRLLYTLDSAASPQSLRHFAINADTGEISVSNPLDRESQTQHLLTVMVRDTSTPSRKAFARVTVSVLDSNDHRPHFLTPALTARVYESSALGTSVAQPLAVDRDHGDNARLSYSILSGNVGGVFAINEQLGLVTLAGELDRSAQSEYNLVVMATDHGSPPLSNTCSVTVQVTLSDNAPPRFLQHAYTVELRENRPVDSVVAAVEAASQSSVVFAIGLGNDKGYFAINPNSGVIAAKVVVDYEQDQVFNLTVSATNLVGLTATVPVLIHVIDENDNAPEFSAAVYRGSVSESAAAGSMVLGEKGLPLVVAATDRDSQQNARPTFSLVEASAKQVFSIHPYTGAIQTVAALDHETTPVYNFTVQVTDQGSPRLRSEQAARVVVTVVDENDSPPAFSQPLYQARLLMPTYRGVLVAQVQASDPDSDPTLTFDLTAGNSAQKFAINPQTGLITVQNEERLESSYNLTVQVSDGKFTAPATVAVTVTPATASGLRFSRPRYYAALGEGVAEVHEVAVVQVTGQALNQHYSFALLNHRDLFSVGQTSGVVMTREVAFDREQQDNYTLVVEVQEGAQDTPRLAHVLVQVLVRDVNDNAPTFLRQPYNTVLPTSARPGDLVTRVVAVDRDIDENGRVDYRLETDGDGRFYINATSGEIFVRNLRKGDENTELALQVVASDRGKPPQSSTAVVPVAIRSRDSPVFERTYYNASVAESAPLHSTVTSVEARSPRGHKLLYSVSSGDKYGEFAVSFSTGLVTVVGELDYELTSKYTLSLRATDIASGHYAETMLDIHVEDVNDNPPQFGSLTYTATVSEAAVIGSSVLTVSASDRDTGLRGQVSYSLAPVAPGSTDHLTFAVDPTSGLVSTRTPLDHERQADLRFLAVATDGGMPALSATAIVHVVVMDVNDNAPEFSQLSYGCGLSDEASRGQMVTRVIGWDADESDRGFLIYSIVSGNERNTFAINESTGVISLSEQRQPALQNAYFLNVSVSDGVLSSYTLVTVDVRPSNQHTPAFTEATYRVQVSELGGSRVAKVTALDEDRGDYGEVSYSLPSQAMRRVFRIDPDTGDVYVEKPLDRERQSHYELQVAASDLGGRTGYATLDVTVADDNDEIPVFLVPAYQAQVHSVANVNTPIIQVRALDYDAGNNGKLEYSLYTSESGSSEANELFQVDKDTGLVSVKSSLRDKEGETFQLFVHVSDQGDTPLRATAPLDVYVMSGSDVPPTFARDSYSYFLPESEPVGKAIATVQARNEMPVKYVLHQTASQKQERWEAKFDISSKGEILIIEPLDREEMASYVLTVEARTQTSPPLVAYVEVSVTLQDENDNPPVFESSPYVVTVAENSDIGTELVKVKAADPDATTNLRYGLMMNSEWLGNVFAVDPQSGWLTLLAPLDRESRDEYNLTVIVTDGSGEPDQPSHTSSTQVVITVADENDNPPVFGRDHYVTAVDEGAHSGTVLVTVRTTDADLGEHAGVTYHIVEGDPQAQFQVHRTGQVFVNHPLDRETQNRYQLTLAATDDKFVSYATITVDILDDNDNAPQCEMPLHTVLLAEDVAVGSPVVQVKATDQDEPRIINSRISYFLSGEGSDHFHIYRESGVIQTAAVLDRETQAEYQLTALAVDGGNRSCATEVLIRLTDVNDNAPQFTLPSTTLSIQEDAPVGTLLTRVTATDPDAGINRQIAYRLGEDSSHLFTINGHSGIISLVGALDREHESTHSLSVIAYNVAQQQLSSSVQLTVRVLDVNDNPPEFERTSYERSLSEATPVGSQVVRVRASSRDIGINADISYSIVAGNELAKFRIHPKTGLVSVAEPLDHELLREYFLTVMAEDGGQPPLSSSTIIRINVTDVNDNAPMFSKKDYSATVREDAAVGTEIARVAATDLDSPANAKVTYSIASGDIDDQFRIEPSDGVVQIQSRLDREKIDKYVLVIQATDSGSPPLSSTTILNIDITDANDNAPRFSESNYTAHVQEGRPVGLPVLTMSVTDDDLPVNGPPFSFDIVRGNALGEFRIDSHGTLFTAAKLRKSLQEHHVLTVRVYDNGQPSLYADANVTIVVVDESTHPPVARNLSISISSYLDRFPGGIIGKVEAQDRDPYDVLTFSVVSPNRHLFDVRSDSGRVVATQGLDAGNYMVNVSVSDGKFAVYAIVDVFVNAVSQAMLDGAVTVQFENMIPEQFFASYLKAFTRVLRQQLNFRKNAIRVINVQPSHESLATTVRLRRSTLDSRRRDRRASPNDLDVLFAVQKTENKFYSKRGLQNKVDRITSMMEQELGVRIVRVYSDVCADTMCERGTCKGEIAFDDSNLVPVIVNGESFVSARHHYVYQCVCSDGSCPGSQLCGGVECPSYKECQIDVTGRYGCHCPDGRAGDMCQEVLSQPCTDLSCHNGRRPMTFGGKSYAKWLLKPSTEKRLSLSMRIRTRKSSAYLMYAAAADGSDKGDFSILEIKRGMVQYNFNCGNGKTTVTIPVPVSDGRWHTISVERNGRQAELFLDGQYKAIGEAVGTNDEVNLPNNDVYFGAQVDVYNNGYRNIQRGFEGCMESIELFSIPLPLHDRNEVALAQEFEKVEFHCKDDTWSAVDNPCASYPCMNGGTCMKTGLNTYFCRCTARYRGDRCEVDMDPCLDKPCLNDGLCMKDGDVLNGFKCTCPGQLQGKRCEYGPHCRPNPCQHGGSCIEARTRALCFCTSGYQGPTCESMVDACKSHQCQNEGQCFLNENEEAHCNCSNSFTGRYCETMVPHLDPSKSGVNTSEIIGIVCVIVVLFILVVIFVLYKVCQRRRRKRKRGGSGDITNGIAGGRGGELGEPMMLSHLKDSSSLKCCKASNPDVYQNLLHQEDQPPPVPTRPASYTPSTHDSLSALNNFDTVRNYGSAADELETTGTGSHVPVYMEFLQTFNSPHSHQHTNALSGRSTPRQANSDADSIQKPTWEFEYPNILENYMEAEKRHSGEKTAKNIPGASPRSLRVPLLRQDASSLSSLPYSESEDDLNGYHWDTSDWAPRPSLPDISEVPSNVIPDSSPNSSPHSSDSNSAGGLLSAAAEDGAGTASDYVDESEYVGDSEFADTEYDELPPSYADHPNYQQILAGLEAEGLEESYNLPQSLALHPSLYLPDHSLSSSGPHDNGLDLNTDDENRADVSDEDDDDDDDNDSVIHFGLRSSSHSERQPFLSPGFALTDTDLTDFEQEPSATDNMSVSVGGNTSANASVSDISGLCDIEDSEVNVSDSDDNADVNGDDQAAARLLPPPSQFSHTQV